MILMLFYCIPKERTLGTFFESVGLNSTWAIGIWVCPDSRL